MTTELSVGRDGRLDELLAAENRAFELLKTIEDRSLIRPGRTEKQVEQDIQTLAETEFGITQHWHKRIVRAGINTLAVFADNPSIRTIEDDDIVFLDLGPVFENWEADIGKTYVIGTDPAKNKLVSELSNQFRLVTARLRNEPDITGADLFQYAKDCASSAGCIFGGAIAGHIVAEFPHARLPGKRQAHHISPENPLPLSALDPLGQKRYWIIEIHLIPPDGKFGAFYERLANVHPV